MADERFDGLFMSIAQQSQGIEPLLDHLFSFLRRKTDFFVGASSEVIENTVMAVIKKHAAIVEEDEKKKKAAREKEERLKKQRLEKERKKKEEERSKQAAPVEDGVLELNEDGSFDTAAAPTPVTAATAAADSSTPPAAPPVATSIMDGPSPDIPSGETPEEEAERIKREEEEDKEPPPPGNGGKTDRYVWTQQLADLVINVPMPPGTKSKMLDVKFTNNTLKVGIKGQPYIIDGEFYNRIIVDDSFWTLEDGDVVLTLQKDNRMEWWKCAIKGDPEINTQKVQPENSKLGDLDGETRQTVEKMMFDQRQKAMGKPTADEMQKQEMLKKFMDAHPEMDFSNTKFS